MAERRIWPTRPNFSLGRNQVARVAIEIDYELARNLNDVETLVPKHDSS